MTASRAYIGIVGLVVAGYFFVPAGDQSFVYNAIGMSAAVAMLIGVRWHWAQPRTAWTLIALGVLAFATGDIAFGDGQSVPSPADVLYISGYPLIALGLFGLAPRSVTNRKDQDVVVAVSIALAVAVVSWLFLIAPAGDDEGVTLVSRIVALGYPAMDVALIGLLVRAAAGSRFRLAHFQLLGAALGLMLVADVGYALQDFGTAYSVGSALDAAWLLQYACFGGALLHQSIGDRISYLAEARVAPASRGGTVALQLATAGLRFETVATSAGVVLVVMSGVTLFVAVAWLAGDVVMLAGAYGVTGFLMVIAGQARARI